jgi:4-hydroxybenzoate polyprenyltransferase/phosphoserine phosphatase
LNNTIPLVIDLDGTLIRSDILVESGFAFLKQNPLHLFRMVNWLIISKARLKRELAEKIDLDVTTLPYVPEVLEFIKEEKSKGRKIVLATASHMIYARKIADHLELFDDVIATEVDVNLTSIQKAERLVSLYGKKGFDYAGNSMDDIAVWPFAKEAILVNPETGVLGKAKQIGNISKIIDAKLPLAKTLLKAFRIHQWAKNALIFVPLLASHQISNLDKIADGIIAFILFGLCASSVYLLNDLLDIQDDRHHQTKRKRPFASGALSIKTGVLLFPFLLVGSFAGAYLLLPLHFLLALAVYYVLTVLYSFSLKRIVVVDVITLAILYTMRMIAGTFAFEVSLTFWMLAFSMFIFLSLALVKRYTELAEARSAGNLEKARGRGYYPDDLEMISSLGAAAGYISVMVLALYIQDTSTISLYTRPQLIWLACPILLFWMSRVWLLAHRGQMHDDPVVFAIKDKVSIVVGLLFGLIFWLAV